MERKRIAMNKIQITRKNKKYTFSYPSRWDEMDRRQLLLWCGILRMELLVGQALDLVIFLFAKIPKSVFAKMPFVYRLQLRDTVSFLEENTITANILGYVRVMFRKYHGPGHKLANLTIGEWRRTELYYELWSKTGQNKYLHLLAATLFRPSGKYRGDDIRCRLTENTISRRAHLFAWAMHPNALKAIQLFYEGTRAYVQRRFPKIYRNTGEQSQSVGKQILHDWEDTILTYSGDKLGNFAETSETNLYVFLKHMTERIEELEKLKARK